jgi:nicotinamidase-related amidase
MSLLDREDAVLVVVDVQESLLRAIHDADRVVANTARLIEAAKVFSVPIVITLQNPERLGGCPQPVEDALPHAERLTKMAFSCYRVGEFAQKLRDTGRGQVLLCGVEAHVCINQTAHDLVSHGYRVHVVKDACSSRTDENRQVAMDRMREIGCVITSTEMAIFELTREAGTPEFKQILPIVK